MDRAVARGEASAYHRERTRFSEREDSMSRVKVAINGYGVIGKRVADAVALQDDMEVAGVSEVSADWRIRIAVGLGLPVFAPGDDERAVLRDGGIPVAGLLADLLDQADVIVDCTPKGLGQRHLELYRSANVKAILQGGEKHETTGHSFVAEANYETALGLDATRVVSCNTTATVRLLGALDAAGLLTRARGVLLRRATDPWESHLGGIMNTIVPERAIPSHQGPDAKTVMPHLDVVTMACKVPETLGHLHYWWVELSRVSSKEEVLDVLRRTPRVAFARAADGLGAVNAVEELANDLGRPRNDLWELVVWDDILSVSDRELFLCQQVDNQAIVVPETIDAIRALTGVEPRGEASIAKTDRALGMVKDLHDPFASAAGGRPGPHCGPRRDPAT